MLRGSFPPLSRRALLGGVGASLLAAPWARADQAASPRPAIEHVKLMFCGDSLAQGLFLTMTPVMRRRDAVRLLNGTQHATGITRSDEHDWPTVTKELVTRHQPNLVVFWIGANDFRPLVLRAQRSRFQFGTPAFIEHYGLRVAEMVGAVTAGNGRAVWLGLPNMRDTQFAGAARTLNEVQQAASSGAGAIFVPTWEATSDAQGRYMPVLEHQRGPRPLRAEDGVHFTDVGYRRVANLAFEAAVANYPELALGLAPAVEA